MEKYEPKDPAIMKLSRKDAVGKQIGNFIIKEALPNDRVAAKCTLCGNEDYVGRWYKIKTGHTTSCGCKHKLINPEKHIGEKHHKLIIKSILPEKDKDGAVMALCKCDCGNDKVYRLNTVLRGLNKSCGRCNARYNETTEDKKSRKKLNDIWRQMMKRCYMSGNYRTDNPELKFLENPRQHSRYYDYGARGIDVDPAWHKFENFRRWHMENMRPGETMDRVNNDAGYGPDNIKSATIQWQNINQRVRRDNKTGFKGIRWSGSSYLWTVKNDGKAYKKEGFKTIEQALIERNIFIIKNNLPHVIQKIPTLHSIKPHYSPVTDAYHIAVVLNSNSVLLSDTTFSKRDNKLMQSVIRAMK